jgi:hypothetical protein
VLVLQLKKFNIHEKVQNNLIQKTTVSPPNTRKREKKVPIKKILIRMTKSKNLHWKPSQALSSFEEDSGSFSVGPSIDNMSKRSVA